MSDLSPEYPDDGPTSDRDQGDINTARRQVQAILDGRLPMDTAAYSAAIMMVLWTAGWRPRHLSTSMDRCDIADGWWRLGRGWRQRFEAAQSEVDRLRNLLHDVQAIARSARAEAKGRRNHTAQLRAENEQMAAAIQRVRQLHTRGDKRCAGCLESWPCATVYTLDGE